MKCKKIIISIIVACVLIPAVFVTYFLYNLEWKIKNIAISENKDVKYRVVVQEIGTPLYFGPSEIKIVYGTTDGKNIRACNDLISNDGKALDSSNVSIEWRKKYVEVTLCGEEQKPKKHIFKY